MKLGLTGKVALVTGAARGIGAAIARELALEGCDIALLDHHAELMIDGTAADVQRAGARAFVLKADVRDYERAHAAIDEVVTRFGTLDILVCNAGITRDHVSWKMSEADWDDVLAVNLKGCFNYARAAAALFRAGGHGGRIVSISSINGLRGKVGQASYAASKAGMIGLSKTLARELGRFGVTVNVVAPGMVLTPMARALNLDVLESARAETALGKLTTLESVAAVVAFLCSERAAYITGEVIRVDAGQHI